MKKKMITSIAVIVFCGCLGGSAFLNASARDRTAAEAQEEKSNGSVASRTGEPDTKKQKQEAKQETTKKTDAKEAKKEDKKSTDQGDKKDQKVSSEQKKSETSQSTESSNKSAKNTSEIAGSEVGSGGSDSGKASVNQSSDNSLSSSNNQSSNDTKPAPEKNKVWVEPKYEEKTTPEEGHWETRTIQEAWEEQGLIGEEIVCYCGETFESVEAAGAHAEASGRGSACTGNYPRPKYGTIYHEAVTGPVWVVDKAAGTERVKVAEGYWK